jgi:hypothetical protein
MKLIVFLRGSGVSGDLSTSSHLALTSGRVDGEGRNLYAMVRLSSLRGVERIIVDFEP